MTTPHQGAPTPTPLTRPIDAIAYWLDYDPDCTELVMAQRGPAQMARYILDLERQLAQREERCRELEGALAPFAKFVFGPGWAGHSALAWGEDPSIVHGYDSDGKETGINVYHSDFARARALLTTKLS